MSNTNFTCIPNRIFYNGMLYSQAELKLRGLMRLLPKDELDIYLALRGPVTFCPMRIGDQRRTISPPSCRSAIRIACSAQIWFTASGGWPRTRP
jgi:hypothetical protein